MVRPRPHDDYPGPASSDRRSRIAELPVAPRPPGLSRCFRSPLHSPDSGSKYRIPVTTCPGERWRRSGVREEEWSEGGGVERGERSAVRGEEWGSKQEQAMISRLPCPNGRPHLRSGGTPPGHEDVRPSFTLPRSLTMGGTFPPLPPGATRAPPISLPGWSIGMDIMSHYRYP